MGEDRLHGRCLIENGTRHYGGQEKNLSECLDSVSWSDDLVVLDSGSTDKTLEIADKSGAKVIERQFDNYAAQRNFGLSFNFKYEWILMLDADERITPDLKAEIQSILGSPNIEFDCFWIPRQNFFLGKKIKYVEICRCKI